VTSAASDYLGPKEDGPRRFAEKTPENRSEAERDHDRILYTSAVQRLAGITQIAAPESGPPLHNRLTHTLKVAQVARRLAKRLGLDEDGQETAAAAALAHDLGHPPFGHIAEKELNRLADDWGGFEGNAQSFRIVNTLAARDPAFWGLNLTRRTLNGILKYPWLRDKDDSNKKSKKWGAYEHEKAAFRFAREDSEGEEPSIEAAIMDWSDDVTYAVHDLEDFFRVGLIPLDRLTDPKGDERRRFRDGFFKDDNAKRMLRDKFIEVHLTEGDLDGALDFVFGGAFGDITAYRGSRPDRIALRYQTSALIGRFIQAVSLNGKRKQIEIKAPQRAEVTVLKELAWYYVITDPSLATIQHGEQRVICELHDIYCKAVDDPDNGWKLFPLAQQELLDVVRNDERRYRVATDFVAGLTEGLAYELHHRLTGVSRGSIMDAAARATR
jgi:dGTPase